MIASFRNFPYYYDSILLDNCFIWLIILFGSQWIMMFFTFIIDGCSKKIPKVQEETVKSNHYEQYFDGIFSKSRNLYQNVKKELAVNHPYCSFFLRSRKNYSSDKINNKYNRLIQLISNNTIAFFSIILLFRLQSPNLAVYNCENYTASNDCLSEKSFFDSSKAICKWDNADYCSINNQEYYFNYYSLSIIILIVACGMGFIKYFMAILCKRLVINHRNNKCSTNVGKDGTLKKEDKNKSEQSKDVKSKKKAKLNNKMIRLQNDLTSYRFKIQHYTNPILDEVESAIRNKELLQHFDKAWGIKTSLVLSDKKIKLMYVNSIYKDMKAASVCLERNVINSPANPGEYLMYLFIIDMLGGFNSPLAKIFHHKIGQYYNYSGAPSYSLAAVILWTLLLVLGDAYIVYLSIGMVQYDLSVSENNTYHERLVYSCIAYVVFDIFVIEMAKVVWIQCVIPLIIRNYLIQIQTLIHSTFENDDINELPTFSASDHLFMSVKVARKYSVLPESKYILNYRNPFPMINGVHWHHNGYSDALKYKLHLVDVFSPTGGQFVSNYDENLIAVTRQSCIYAFFYKLYYTIQWLLVTYGASVSVERQLLLTHLLQPLFCAGALFGIYQALEHNKNNVGYYIILACIIVLGLFIVSMVYYLCTLGDAPNLNELEESLQIKGIVPNQGNIDKSVDSNKNNENELKYEDALISCISDSEDSDREEYYSYSKINFEQVKTDYYKSKIKKNIDRKIEETKESSSILDNLSKNEAEKLITLRKNYQKEMENQQNQYQLMIYEQYLNELQQQQQQSQQPSYLYGLPTQEQYLQGPYMDEASMNYNSSMEQQFMYYQPNAPQYHPLTQSMNWNSSPVMYSPNEMYQNPVDPQYYYNSYMPSMQSPAPVQTQPSYPSYQAHQTTGYSKDAGKDNKSVLQYVVNKLTLRTGKLRRTIVKHWDKILSMANYDVKTKSFVAASVIKNKIEKYISKYAPEMHDNLSSLFDDYRGQELFLLKTLQENIKNSHI